MREISLREYEKSEPIALTVAQRDALEAVDGLSVTPVRGESDRYILRPSSIVGAVEVGGLSVLIRPKIKTSLLISLAYYDPDGLVDLRDEFDYPEEWALPDALARMFAEAAEKAFARGLLHGYVEREESLQTVRGRIRFDEQIRRRFGLPLPVEVRYDEFTDDVLPNRLVKAANRRMRRAGLRSMETRRKLGRIDAMLDGVSLCAYPPKAVPEMRFDRLNRHYERAVALARLILRHDRFEASRGDVRAPGFLMDMNKVFQEFVTAALREQLGLSASEFGERWTGTLDEEGEIRLKPDLVWREGGRCVFVGDAKYKRIPSDARVPNADLYQMLAYATALDLPGGLLIYAKDDETSPNAPPGDYRVRHADKTLKVTELDLSGDLDAVLARVGKIADKVRALRAAAKAASAPPHNVVPAQAGMTARGRFQ